MREIQLSHGFVTSVDDDDYDYLMRWKWRANRVEHTTYAYRAEVENGKKRRIYLHRALLGAMPTEEVDHKDSNGLNNQRSNLRICREQENRYNLRPWGTSFYKGVSWDGWTGRWVAKISYKGKRQWLGRFTLQAEAAQAYDQKAKELFGEFAYLNFPAPPPAAGAR